MDIRIAQNTRSEQSERRWLQRTVLLSLFSRTCGSIAKQSAIVNTQYVRLGCVRSVRRRCAATMHIWHRMTHRPTYGHNGLDVRTQAIRTLRIRNKQSTFGRLNCLSDVRETNTFGDRRARNVCGWVFVQRHNEHITDIIKKRIDQHTHFSDCIWPRHRNTYASRDYGGELCVCFERQEQCWEKKTKDWFWIRCSGIDWFGNWKCGMIIIWRIMDDWWLPQNW